MPFWKIRTVIRLSYLAKKYSAVTRLIEGLPETVSWRDDKLFLLDQTRLPHEEIVLELQTAEDVWQSIKLLKVRGAPAIGVAAAYGLCVALRNKKTFDRPAFLKEVETQAAYLDSARPTAVNLGWALKRLQVVASVCGYQTGEEIFEALLSEAVAIHEEDRQLCMGIGQVGAELIAPGCGVLTHCNAGALATTGIGTATAPMYVAHDQGVSFRVYADETRPLLQGARITSWELQRSGLDVTLNTDSMAAHLMSQGLIDLVIVGTDRVAANGDVANKIGTLGVAILARHFGIPFYVACPSSTYDPFTEEGMNIVIEERDGSEVRSFDSAEVATRSIKVRNPAFDVTPAQLVTGLITEKGIIESPNRECIGALLGK